MASAPEAVRLPLKRRCESCGSHAAPLRRCTGQRLCAICRLSPEHKVVSRAAALRKTGLPPTALNEGGLIPAGYAPNPKNPAFAPIQLLWCRDVFQLLADLGRSTDVDL